MIKTIKHIISVCAVTSLLALSFIGCAQPTAPEVKYKVSFDENGHGTKPDAIEVTESTILSKEQLKPLTTNEEFTFVGWFDESDKQAIGGEYKVTKNVTLKAKWTEKTYTVTFQNDKGTAPKAITGLKKNSTLKTEQIKPLDNIEGFDFAGWTVDGKPFDSNYPITKDITVSANWTKQKVTITYTTVHGNLVTTEKTVDYGYKLIPSDLLTPTDTDHHFGGWYIDNEIATVDTVIKKNTVLTANWLIPEITSFIIPTKYIMSKGKTFYAEVKGNNLNLEGLTVKLTCTGNSSIVDGASVEVIDANKVKVGLKVPENIGTYTINVSIGNCNKDGTLNVHYTPTIGDILLSDGSYENYFNLNNEQKTKAIAIVCGINEEQDKILGMGVKISNVNWASKDTTGFTTNFNEIVCTPSKFNSIGKEDTVTFTGDLDGSDNWEKICAQDSNAATTAETNYPAFNWANNYGKTLPEGYQDGWYIPSIYELSEYVYKNNVALKDIVKKFDFRLMGYFVSSSQVESKDSSVWTFCMDDNNFRINMNKKNGHENVCCFRAF